MSNINVNAIRDRYLAVEALRTERSRSPAVARRRRQVELATEPPYLCDSANRQRRSQIVRKLSSFARTSSATAWLTEAPA